jgi:hypothetical protein
MHASTKAVRQTQSEAQASGHEFRAAPNAAATAR